MIKLFIQGLTIHLYGSWGCSLNLFNFLLKSKWLAAVGAPKRGILDLKWQGWSKGRKIETKNPWPKN